LGNILEGATVGLLENFTVGALTGTLVMGWVGFEDGAREGSFDGA